VLVSCLMPLKSAQSYADFPLLVLLTLVVIATLYVAFFVFRPSTVVGKFPSRFSDAERREISSLIRGDGYRRSFRHWKIGGSDL
jgi:hypothetical protein